MFLNEQSNFIEIDSKQGLLQIQVKINPSTHKKSIVINYPGVYGDIDGYSMKYGKLSKHMSEKIGTVLRISGPEDISGISYEEFLVNKLDSVIKYALENSLSLTGLSSDEVEIYLIGFSAGASGVAAISSRYPPIKKILLIAPGGDAGEEVCNNGLRDYKGEFYGVVGENDEIVGKNAVGIFAEMAKNAKLVRKLIIPNCDHQFRGTNNGLIMSSAPIWAFNNAGEGDINPEDGIILY